MQLSRARFLLFGFANEVSERGAADVFSLSQPSPRLQQGRLSKRAAGKMLRQTAR